MFVPMYWSGLWNENCCEKVAELLIDQGWALLTRMSFFCFNVCETLFPHCSM